jgi:hypothetical protein
MAGPSGTAGQGATTVFGSGGLSVQGTDPAGAFTVLPGLSQTVTLPANSVLLIATDGGMVPHSNGVPQGAAVDVAIFIDGVQQKGARRAVASNSMVVNPGVGLWSLTLAVPVEAVGAGAHAIDVRVGWRAGTTSADVSSGDNPSVPRQGQLTVTILSR